MLLQSSPSEIFAEALASLEITVFDKYERFFQQNPMDNYLIKVKSKDNSKVGRYYLDMYIISTLDRHRRRF